MKPPPHSWQLFMWLGREAHETAAEYETRFQREQEALAPCVFPMPMDDEDG